MGGGAACGGRGCMWGEGLHVLYSRKKLHQNILQFCLISKFCIFVLDQPLL